MRINTLRTLVYDFSSRIDREMVPLESILTPLEQGVSNAEEVVKITSTASFQWKEGETPIVAVHAKYMNAKMEDPHAHKPEDNLQREKEIILKKTLFIVTEKKERTPILGTPNRINQ
jgi:hypothetical protein